MSFDLRNQSEDDFSLPTFESDQIFIGREQQIDLFEIYFDRWKRFVFNAQPNEMLVTSAPTPYNKVQGLVILLYGRGGFGKSTLLRRYREIVLKESQNPLFSSTTVSEVVDWEFAVGDKRSLFNLAQGQDIDAWEYFRIICRELAIALNKRPQDFREYQSTVRDLERIRKKASNTLNAMQKEDQYSSLRGLTVEAILALIRTYVPGSGMVLDQPVVKSASNEIAKLTQEQLVQIHSRLHDKLGSEFGDYLEAPMQLGLALGRDLHDFAKNSPLLIFFDTYEEIDEGDQLFRSIMGAAGIRVGWILAGRDNLWAGTEQRERAIDMEYGYKDIVVSERGLAIDFNAGGVGAFTISDITEYFERVRAKVQYEPPLPLLTKKDVISILHITQGVPLAVKLAAGLYVETSDLNIVTSKLEGKRKIVDEMVQRYLLHTRADQSERTRLYGLALLRRVDQPAAVAAALGLTPEESKTNYMSELSRLQRRYSFIFNGTKYPSLHQEVRYFLRLWLLEHRTQPEIMAVNERLKETHVLALKRLEEHRLYSNLRNRLEDEEWTATYLDLIEQVFWLDPVEGVDYALPFMQAASIYLPEINQNVAKIGDLFETTMPQRHLRHWKWAVQSLTQNTGRSSSKVILSGLQELIRLAEQGYPRFSSALLQKDYQKELEALLWWRLGEVYRTENENKAFEWFEKALSRLEQETELHRVTSRTAHSIGHVLVDEKKYMEAKSFFKKAIELEPLEFYIYNDMGNIYHTLGDYPNAIENYDYAIKLNPSQSVYYFNRGASYFKLKDYQRALADVTSYIKHNSKNADAYFKRGIIYYELGKYQKAIAEYDQSIKLDYSKSNTYNMRGIAYYELKEYQQAIADYNQAIKLNPSEGSYYLNRGIVYVQLKDYPQVLTNCDRAFELDPKLEHAAQKFKGKVFRDLGMYQEAVRAMLQALVIEPNCAECELLLLKTYRAFHKSDEIPKLLQEISLPSTNQVQVLHVRAGLMSLTGQYEEALKDLERVIELERSLIDDLFNMQGLVFSYLGRYAEAIECYEQELKKNPDYYVALYNIAVAMTRWKGYAISRKQIDIARTSLINAQKSNDTPEVLYGLGGLKALEGKKEQALDYLQQAISYKEQIIVWALHDIAWLDLRNNLRFHSLLQELN